MKVILVHGFSKNPKDMKPLERNLDLLGYECFAPKLPLTFKEFDYSAFLLSGYIDELVQSLNLTSEEKIHLVGHSTGGLVIRKFIKDTKYASQIGRCVLIGTPNRGSRLAEIAVHLKPIGHICRTLKSLCCDYVEKINLLSDSDIEIAAIGGNKNNLLLGNLIREENDGRVELRSVYYPGLTDYITLPYGHTEIHHQPETAKLVDIFLKNGKF